MSDRPTWPWLMIGPDGRVRRPFKGDRLTAQRNADMHGWTVIACPDGVDPEASAWRVDDAGAVVPDDA